MKELPVLLELPAAYYRELGRVAVSSAYLEYTLGLIVFDILGISPVKGRLAVRQPGPKEIYEMIVELGEIDEIEFDNQFSKFQSTLEECTRHRDQLLHGVWVRQHHDDRIYLRLTSGTWQPVPGMKGKVKRRTKPQGVEFGVDEIRGVHTKIRSAIDAALLFRNQLQELISIQRGKL